MFLISSANFDAMLIALAIDRTLLKFSQTHNNKQENGLFKQ